MTPDILMLSAAHPPDDVRIAQKEGAALAAAGFRVAHLAPGEGGARDAFGLRLLPFPAARGWAARLRGIPALARRAAALRPAAIQAHEPDSWLAGLIAARRCGARLVIDVHEHYPSRLDPRLPAPLRPVARGLLRAACRWLGARADAVVVAKAGLDDAFGGPARCTPVRNYADPVPLAPRRHAAGPVALLHLGALGRARGAFAMLDALALLPGTTRLVLAGRFTDGSEAAFRTRAAALGLDARVEIHPWMPREAALALAARCDVALVLFQPGVENHRLALPHKLFDAMLAGLPVVVPDFAEEVAAVVAEAGCGIAVDTADPARVAAALHALHDPARRAELGARGRAAALGRFGWAGEAARLVALHRGLAAGHR
ncbi:glycosyltransferase [Falsiroseomonas sp. CW058]|uniref:glycosyltransferase n=1 Tax=Falsiroseomonas sp. CW058 TaxID=3388664 RepID=UPI003D320ED2